MNIEKEILEISIDDIIPNRFQPREKFEEKDLNELAQSIKEHGVINPIVVRKIGDKYEIVAGERRHKASILAGKNLIPAIVANINDYESAEIALIENIQRKDLTPIEEAKTYQTILKIGALTQDKLAQRMGKTQPTIANKLRLLELDKGVQQALLDGKISERHARSLLSVENKDKQKELLEKIIDNRMTVRETDLEIKKILDINNIDINEIKTDEAIEIIGEEEPKTTPPQNNPIGFDEIAKIKKEAVDIKITKPEVDINSLLKAEKKEIIEPSQNNRYRQFELENNSKFINLDNNNPAIGIENDQINVPNIQSINYQEPARPTNIETYVTGDLRAVINTIRQCISTIEKYGFAIDSEEFDFEQMYQVIIKINKK